MMGFEFINPSLWFVCKLCKDVFPDPDKLKAHKLKNHLTDCFNIKCIVFEEKLLDHEWNPSKKYHPEGNSESELKCETVFEEADVSLLKSDQEIEISVNPKPINFPTLTNNREFQFEKQPELSAYLTILSNSSDSNRNVETKIDAIEQFEGVSFVKTELSEFTFTEEEDKDPFGDIAETEGHDLEVADSVTEFPIPIEIQESEPLTNIVLISLGSANNETSTSASLARLSPAPTVQNPIINKSDNRFMCSICFYSFRTRNKLSCHMRKHSEDKPFKCPHCPLAFKHKYSVENHLIIHGRVTDFQCRFCGKSFNKNKTLEDHERTHTNERPFKCQVGNCDKAFISRNTLTMHIRSKHSEELGYQQFLCPSCGRAFGMQYQLKRHLQRKQCKLDYTS